MGVHCAAQFLADHFQGGTVNPLEIDNIRSICSIHFHGQAPNCRQLARELEVSRRTVLRDIEFLKSDLGAPVKYDARRRGYVYTEPNWIMPSVRITEGELLALMVAEKALDAYAGTPWADRLRDAFDRMTAALPDRVEIAPRDLLTRVDFAPEAEAETSPEVIKTLNLAIRDNQVLEMDYQGLGRDRPRQYTVDPYILRHARGAWYLAAREHRSGQVPLYNVSRIRRVRPTGATFDYDASGFDPKAYFAGTFGTHQTSERYRVAVEFSGWAARLVQERRWHASQKFVKRPGGRIRFEVEVAHLDDIWPWILSWGSEAKVLKPEELASKVARHAAALARQYSDIHPSTTESKESQS